MCDTEARLAREAADAGKARASVTAAREELRDLRRYSLGEIPVTPEEEHAWIELEQRIARGA